MLTIDEVKKQAAEILGTELIALICDDHGEPLPYRIGTTVADPLGEHIVKCPCCDELMRIRIDVRGTGESWEAALGDLVARKSA